jgi:hypothetical protein
MVKKVSFFSNALLFLFICAPKSYIFADYTWISRVSLLLLLLLNLKYIWKVVASKVVISALFFFGLLSFIITSPVPIEIKLNYIVFIITNLMFIILIINKTYQNPLYFYPVFKAIVIFLFIAAFVGLSGYDLYYVINKAGNAIPSSTYGGSRFMFFDFDVPRLELSLAAKGGSLLYFSMLAYFISLRHYKINLSFENKILITLSAVLLLLSQSLSGALLTIVFFMVLYLDRKNYRNYIIKLIFIVPLMIYLHNFLISEDFGSYIVLIEAAQIFLSSLTSTLINGVGFGLLEYDNTLSAIAHITDISIFARFSLEIGVISVLIFLLLIYFMLRKIDKKAIVFIMFSGIAVQTIGSLYIFGFVLIQSAVRAHFRKFQSMYK